MGQIFSEGIVVGVSASKGGVGKSVITSLIANYFHRNYNDFKILVCDCDDRQTSLVHLRNTELSDNENLDKSTLYDLIDVGSNNFPNNVEAYKAMYDIIFVDLPGNSLQKGVIECYCMIDIIFMPTQTSPLDLMANIQFIDFVRKEIEPLRKGANFPATEYYAFYNRVDVNNKDFKEFYQQRSDFGFPYLENYIPESKVTFQRNASTIGIYENQKYEDYKDFCQEVMSKIIDYKEKY